MKKYESLIEANALVVRKKLESDPHFYENLAKGQKPNFLWIGCSDSRVPANEITGTEAGDIFVHRNIANLIQDTDLNAMSVIAYAVNVLKVNHVIICGHYGCGGVQAAMSKMDVGLINNWIRNIKSTYAENWDDLKNLDEHGRFNRLVELNVLQQVSNLSKSAIMQKEWKERNVYIHGWVFDLKTGLINDMGLHISGTDGLHDVFKLDV